ncbi:MAG: hypothetical protein AAFU67_16620 [Bacteroidota bacterium]
MPIPEELEKKVEDLITEGETEMALQELRDHMVDDPDRDTDAYRQVILLTGQYNVWEKEKLQGIKSDSSEFNRITSQVLVLLDNLRFKRKKRIIAPPVEPPSPPEPPQQQPAFQAHQAPPIQTSNLTKSNNQIGKYIRWGLMGLGAFFLLMVIIVALEDTGSGDPYPALDDFPAEDVFTPQSDNFNASVFQTQLGNTVWWNANLGYVYFSANGMSATYQNGNGSFNMTGQNADGYMLGEFSDTSGSGNVMMIPPNGATILFVYVKHKDWATYSNEPLQLLQQ